MNGYSEVLYVLHIALIEIRATENLKKARVFADVVHNVPSMIKAGRAEEEIVEEVMLKANRQGVGDYFLKLFAKAKTE
jgi:transcriptional regulator